MRNVFLAHLNTIPSLISLFILKLRYLHVFSYWHCLHSMQSRIHETVRCPSVRLSIWAHSSKPAAAGLLLWARWTGDGQLQQRRAPGKCWQCHVVSVRRQLNRDCLLTVAASRLQSRQHQPKAAKARKNSLSTRLHGHTY